MLNRVRFFQRIFIRIGLHFILTISIIGCQEPTKQQPNNQEIVPVETKNRLKAIYEEGKFKAKSFQGAWGSSGSSYFLLETKPGKNEQELVRYDASNGERKVVSQLISPESHEPLTVQNFSFSEDGADILLHTKSQESNYWMLELKSGKLKKVKEGLSPVISPDGRMMVFSAQKNLHALDLQTNRSISLTKDTNEAITNNGAVWSPDSKRIVFVQSDASDVRLRSEILPGDPTYPEVREVRYARVGTSIAKLRIGVVNVTGGQVIWLPIPAPPEGFYFGQISWAGNSSELLIEKLSRFRDSREFLLINTINGSIKTVYEDSHPTWVVASNFENGGFEWIRDHNAFIVMNERDGWRHAYIYSREGKELALLTPDPSDIITRVKVDEAAGWFYYYASPTNATQKYLYRVGLNGNGKAERVTPIDQPGTHDYKFSQDAKWAFHTYSTFDTPPVTELVQLENHKTLLVLEDNKDLHNRMDSIITHPTEFFQLDIGDGVIMDSWMIKPKDFDPSRKYPIFFLVYGEPHSQTVLDVWGRSHSDYHRVIADLGYIVVSMDNRGTPAPKGAAWRRAVAGSLGPLSTEEQAAGVEELGRTRPYVDLSRVGIWGWSGGGSNTLNAMFRKPDVYHVGIAVAAKPQPHLYNAWFQEIYMKTPEVNPEGYQKSAPINFAEGLKGDLLIIHGTGETNTHLQIMEGLVDRLITLGKQFDYMTYPNRNHGLSEGEGTALHLRMQMTRYLLQHLPPGPQ
jgi:dipeptidyl-peptidase-4